MKGVWLIQIGSPVSPTPWACFLFLKEFLQDPYVISLPWWWRRILGPWMIAPLRALKVYELYQKIWLKTGNPLRFYSQQLEQKLNTIFEGQILVRVSMRYGAPSLKATWKEFSNKKIDDLLIIPLFPHYSWATTESVINQIRKFILSSSWKPKIKYIPYFYEEEAFLKAWLSKVEPLNLSHFDHFLFSYHGLPVEHLRRIYTIYRDNKFCYRTQCFETTKKLASLLKLPLTQVSTTFQSKFGKGEWITPQTEEQLKALAQQGVKRIMVFCPSFVMDCLETLEEIGLRGKAIFLTHGGQDFTLVAPPNDDPLWLTNLIKTHF